MSRAEARALLLAYARQAVRHGGDTAHILRVLALLPWPSAFEEARAAERLEEAGYLWKGGERLNVYGLALACRVGAALHAGLPLPDAVPL